MEKQKEVSKYIENFLKEKDYKLEAISKMTGASLSAVGHYKTGERTPKDEFIDKFIEAFNLNVEEKNKLKLAVALDRTPDIIKKKLAFVSNGKFINDTLITVPVLAVASAGSGKINFEETPLKTITIPKNGYDEGTYLIEVEGQSMEPIIKDGSYIVIDPKDIEIQNDKIYVVNYDGQVYIKKVIVNKEIKAIILKSVNPKYEDKYITENMLEHFKIIGRAVGFILTGKL